MPISDFDAPMTALINAFFPGRPVAAFAGTVDEYAEVLARLDWLDDALFWEAVRDCKQYVDKLPTARELLQVCREAKAERDREDVRNAARLLPAPEAEPSIAEGGAPGPGYLGFREFFRQRFGREPDGSGLREQQAVAAREATRRGLLREQATRELKTTAKGRAFLKETTYDDLVQAELRHFTEGR